MEATGEEGATSRHQTFSFLTSVYYVLGLSISSLNSVAHIIVMGGRLCVNL